MVLNVLWLTKWVVSSLFSGFLYQEAVKIFGKDKFESLTEKALVEVLKIEDNRIIYNKIYEKGDYKFEPSEFDLNICALFTGKDAELCQNFFKDLKKEYLKQLYKLGKKDPVTRYLLDGLSKLDDHEARIQILESIFPDILELFGKYYSVERKLEDTKAVIETTKPDIKDFVGRKEIIETFPQGDVFIRGNAAFGKTYLMVMLSNMCSGCYIPLDEVYEIEVFEGLVREAQAEDKRIFIDDFHRAGPEIQAYVQAYTKNVVLSSREEPSIRRNFTYVELSLLNAIDIKDYFSVYHITIADETLKILKEDLNFPIKLRIFVHHLRTKGVKHLDNVVLKEILEDLGLEKFVLPDELHEFYRVFVFNLLDTKQRELCYILSLLRFPASVGRLSHVADYSAGESSLLLEKMLGILKVHEGGYSIFHETFREFCLSNLGDSRELNRKIGCYFEELVETESDFEGKVEGMYHYRKSESRTDFKRVFDLEVVNGLIRIGLWIEAREDLEFALKTSIDEKTKADTIQVLGTVFHRMGYWNRAMAFYGECQALYERLDDVHGMAQTYGNLGSVYVDKGEWDTAINYYEKSLEIFERLGDIYEMAKTYNNLGSVYFRKRKWDEAIDYYNKDLEISKRLGDVHGMAHTYDNLGLVYAEKGIRDKAIDYYKKSQEIFERLGDVYGSANTYNNMGEVYAQKKELDKAIDYFKRALEIFERLGDVHRIALVKFNIAGTFAQNEEFDKALELCLESEKTLKNLGDKLNLMKVYYNLMICYKNMNQKEKAAQYYQKAEVLRKQLGIS